MQPWSLPGFRKRHVAYRLFASAVVLSVCLFGAAAVYLHRALPVIRSLEDYAPKQATRLYADNGLLMGQLFEERRTVVPFASLPKTLIHAFLAAEDATFYEHEGINWWGILRALLKNMRPGAHLQGASTITQQTVKTLLVGNERSYTRKLREALLAHQLETVLSKDEILQIYLSQIYFGNGAYGIEEAAQTYFGHSVQSVSVAEAALLAAVPKNPARYNLRGDRHAAQARQGYVLRQMQAHRFITASEAESALAEPLPPTPAPDPFVSAAVSYVEHVRRELLTRYAEQVVLTGGLQVWTGAQPEIQVAASRALLRSVGEVNQRLGFAGPLAHFEPDQIPRLLAEARLVLERNRTHYDLTVDVDAYVWSLEGLTSNTQVAPGVVLRATRAVLGEEFTHVRALVTQVNDAAQTAQVDLGNQIGLLKLSEMAWAKQIYVKDTPRRATRMSQILRPGDLIAVALGPEPLQNTLSAKPARSVFLLAESALQAGAVAIAVETRLVRALVGGVGRDFGTGFSHVTQARRQPGSAFKPILYAAALDDHLMTPATLCQDSPIVLRDPATGRAWKPKNYEDGRYDGRITYRTALMRSKNTCSVRLLERLTAPRLIEVARRLGIASPLPSNLTLALGTGEVTLLELANAYASIADCGLYVAPIMIRKVAGPEGRTLEEWGVQNKVHALSEASASVATSMLESVVEGGSGRRALALGRPLAGKTGTSQDSRDTWFVGFSPKLAAGVWMGFDDNRPVGRETGASAALPAWIRLMGEALATTPPEPFVLSPDIVAYTINPDTGFRASEPNALKEIFVPGTLPLASVDALPSIFFEDESEEAMRR